MAQTFSKIGVTMLRRSLAIVALLLPLAAKADWVITVFDKVTREEKTFRPSDQPFKVPLPQTVSSWACLVGGATEASYSTDTGKRAYVARDLVCSYADTYAGVTAMRFMKDSGPSDAARLVVGVRPTREISLKLWWE